MFCRFAQAIAAFVESQQLVLSLFFDADFVATTASGLEAANLVAKFLLTVAEMESLAFKVCSDGFLHKVISAYLDFLISLRPRR